MRKTLFSLAAVLLSALGVHHTNAATSVSVDFFYEQLAPEGEWLDVADYGYAWRPRDVAEDWRPYTDGSWAYTDAGWTWISEEPHAWATYHYGRWVDIDGTGWVWVPDTEWAPAWVSWRRGPKHIGWAPLPPEARFRRTVGISKWADSYYDIGPSNYTFVEARNLGAPRLREVVVQPRENVTIITQTTNITNITYVNNTVRNDGPDYDVVVRESAQPIRRLRLERQVDFEGDVHTVRRDSFRTRIEGESLRVIAPQFIASTTVLAPQTVARRVEHAEVNRGWRNAGPAAEIQKLRVKIKSEAPAPAELPPQPRFERVAVGAATESAPVSGTPAAGGGRATPGTAGAKRASEPGTPPTTAQTPATQPTADAPATPRGRNARNGRAGATPTPTAPTASTETAPTADAPASEAPTPGRKPATPRRNARGTAAAKAGESSPAAATNPTDSPTATTPPGSNTEPTPNESPDATRPGARGARNRGKDQPTTGATTDEQPSAPDAPASETRGKRGSRKNADSAATADPDAATPVAPTGGAGRRGAARPEQTESPTRPKPDSAPGGSPERPDASARRERREAPAPSGGAATERPARPEASSQREPAAPSQEANPREEDAEKKPDRGNARGATQAPRPEASAAARPHAPGPSQPPAGQGKGRGPKKNAEAESLPQ